MKRRQREILGWAMMAAPFVGLAALILTLFGVWETLAVLGAVAALVAWMVVATWLADF